MTRQADTSTRRTNTKKWDNSWFFSLPPEFKCAWQYILDTCDNAGVWDPNFALAELRIFGGKNGSIDWGEFQKSAGERVEKLPNGKWWIKDFIAFQLGTHLRPMGANGKNHVHLNVIALLRRHELMEKYEEVEERKFGTSIFVSAAPHVNGSQVELPIHNLKDRKAHAAELIQYLNQKAKKRFQLTGENVKCAERALKEVSDDAAGIMTMIDRMVEQWSGTRFEEFLRPSTLFGSDKFRERYDQRNDGVNVKAPATGATRATPLWAQIQALEKTIEMKKKNLPGLANQHLDPKQYEKDVEKRKPAVAEIKELKQKLAGLLERQAKGEE